MLILLWGISVGLVFYISQTQVDMKVFDPFEILGVTSSSTPSEIKKAYFQLSLRYHPDKAKEMFWAKRILVCRVQILRIINTLQNT